MRGDSRGDRFRSIAPFVLPVLLALTLLRHVTPAAPVQEGLVAATAPVPEVPLTDLARSPARFLNREVRLTVQFRATVERWDTYLSRFEPGRWLGLEVWPDESFTWDRPVFEQPFGHLFVRRGGGFEPLVRRARCYQRFEVHGRVREVFLGEPWIEVLEVTPLEGEVGEGTILHVTRARELLATGQFSLALEQYERARTAPLPPHALAAVLDEIRLAEEARRLNAGSGTDDAGQSKLASEARDP